MNGFIGKAGLVLCWTCALGGLCGCNHYGDLIDPCYPDRYSYMANKEEKASLAPQVNNGKILDQTIWNYHFEYGTDRLTAGGLEQLAYIARRRPCPDTNLYLQTAQDIAYDASAPANLTESRMELDHKRIQAIQKFLTAQTAGQCAFHVEVHDPAEVGLSAVAVNSLTQQMLTTRFKGGLVGGGGTAPAGGGTTTTPP